MKILLCSARGDGVWFAHILKKEGHDVAWVCKSEKDQNTLAGIVPPPLKGRPEPAKYDLVIFDLDGMGKAADEARTLSPTIGGSEYADKLEEDRLSGLEAMERNGINVPPYERFSSPAEAISWLRKTHKRTVLKPIGEVEDKSLTYVSKDEGDMIAFIEKRLPGTGVSSFILQEVVQGVEVSTEAWWTGSEWVALNHTLEEKKFLTGSLGPATGCAGNVIWMPQKRNAIFEQGLMKMAAELKQIGFVGMIDLNTIVTEGELYGLEWTPRFGYEGSCNLTRLLPMQWGEFLYQVATGQTPTLGQPRAKFAASVRLSVPPYPNAELSRKKLKLPVKGIDMDALEGFYLIDVEYDKEEGLRTLGVYNMIGAPLGTGSNICEAFEAVNAKIKAVEAPDLQYRTDIRQCVEKRYIQLERWGWLRPIG